MMDHQAFIADLDALLNRLACDLVVGLASDEAVKEQLFRIAVALDAAGEAGLAPVAALVRAGAAEARADTAEALLARVDTAWSAWKSGTVTAAPVAPDTPPEPSPISVADPAFTLDEEPDDLSVLESDREIAGMFISEALDHLGTIEATVLELEARPGDRKLLDDLFRPFHTIKGNAGALGVRSVQELAHKVENLLDLARAGRHRVDARDIELVLESVDVLTTMVRDLSVRIDGGRGTDVSRERRALINALHARTTGTDSAAPAAPAEIAAPTPARPPLVAVAELAPTAAAQRRPGTDAAPALPVADASKAPTTAVTTGEGVAASVKVDTRKLDNLVDMVGELVIVQSLIQEDPALQRAVDERLGRNLSQLRRITADLQRSAMSMRMVPIRQTFQKMARLIRDLSRKSGKQADLVYSGEDTELDRRVVEDINDPLMHMVRNSLDHGIEKPEERIRAGKRPTGRVMLSAFHQAGTIVIRIDDDGRGLNADKIRKKALSLGLIRPDEVLPPNEIHELIFRPGFSTADRVTEISGRGVGMDVVRRNIELLRGRVDIQTTPGQGTSFIVKLPLTLAIIDGLLVSVGQQRYVLPTFCIRESLRPRREQLHSVQGQPRMVQVRNALLPLLHLGDLFHVPGAVSDPCEGTVIVIEEDDRQLGLVVDQLLGKQEVVIKSLGPAFEHVRGVAGGAILGDGRIGLILDAHGILGLMGVKAALQAAA